MGSTYGAHRAAATRLGLTPSEYATHLLLGEKWCRKCRAWKARSEFGVDRHRGDGLDAVCRPCRFRRTKPGPGQRERREARARGLAWCCDCAGWCDLVEVSRGRCRVHTRVESRRCYATNPALRERRKAHACRRKRGVEKVPPEGAEFVIEIFDGECAYCPAPADTFDHIIAVALGGKTEPWNIVPACRSCNSRKRSMEIFRWLEGIDPERAVVIGERMCMEHLPTAFHAAQVEGLNASR